MTGVKLCGMMRREDVIAAAELKADYAGFVLTPGFRRSVSRETFEELAGCLEGSGVKRAGVFVDEPIENIVIHYAGLLDVIQLHGSEDESCIRRVKQLTGRTVIKSFTVRSEADIEAARRSSADYVLLDSGKGTGRTFDHSLIKSLDRPFFLAGGLDADNVGGAIASLHPFAVDASSGIETQGRKDKTKMAAFVRAVREGNI